MSKLRQGGADHEGGQLLRLALRRVAQMQAGDLVYSQQSPRRGLRVDRRSRYGPGLHGHPYPEICLMLEGSAALDFQHVRHRFDAGRLAVIEPHVLHCEAYARRRTPYVMLWLVGALPLCYAIVSCYRPASGWDVARRFALRSRYAQRLFGRFDSPQVRVQPDWLEPLRADLLCLLAQMHEAQLRHGEASSATQPAPQQHAQLLQQMRRWLDDHLRDSIRLSDLAQMTRLSPNHLNSLFTQAHGEPIHAYLLRQRMQQAMRLLRQTDMLVKQVAQEVGYSDPLYFSRAFRRFHGRSAQQARQSGLP